MEFLKLFSRQWPESDLMAVREIIAKYLLEKACSEADYAWETKQYRRVINT
jgi:hypothetical protein